MTRDIVWAGPAIEAIPVGRADLLLLDIDEVVLHFIDPFCALIAEYGARLSVDSFRLTGNVRSIATGTAVSGHELDKVTQRLYREQETRQPPVEGVQAALGELAPLTDIVFLTAMTPDHYPARRRLLDACGLPYPMIATTRSKGAVAAELMQRRTGRLVFVDDLPPNLLSVARSVPKASLVHLMANEIFRPHLPPMPAGTQAATGWPDAAAKIRRLLDG
ncbi:hypothetical protein GCM10011390_03760 [Aureimonas endophytica]|uniref:Uncharacterized protein n=1 Tax=Aureimonas endophytica TaxID=2027858 RepID=A0A916ZCN6_9HYPH|nr:hypothetical protein [Aureimonas endophytica]GGD88242.1 hypothetical protein GCM10011390_03760 [Aureimonas endophytica]